MSRDLDWTVEYETLPPDDPPLFEPPPPPPRRTPPWLWAALGLVVLAAALYLLYHLGGRVDPRPEPEPDTDPLFASLESAVALEVRALNTGDREIYDRVQDGESRRLNAQPAPDPWFAYSAGPEGSAGEIQTVALERLDEDSAVTEVRLTWEGTRYRLYWYYRLHQGHWVHTDWQPMNLVDLDHLSTDHVHLPAHGIERREAGVLMRRTESFLDDLSARLNLPAGPPLVWLEFDTALVDYAVERMSAPDVDPAVSLGYRLPSPVRVRWPWDSSPEPLVLGSLGRHIAYDLLVGDAQQEMDPADRAALTLSAVWLAHRLLDLPTVPGTRWLDEAVARDREAAALAFILALRGGAPWTEALSASFSPEAVAAAAGSDDYYGWLARVADPLGRTDPIYRRTGPWAGGSYDLPETRLGILQALDREAEAWVPAGEAYCRAVPDISNVVRGEDWAIATAELGQNWVRVYLLKQVDGEWTLQGLDQAIMGDFLISQGGPYSLTDGPVTITYWAWDEPFLEELRRVIRTAHEETAAAFDLASPPAAYALVPFDDPAGTPFEPRPGAVTLLSPAWLTTPTYPEIDYRSRILIGVIGALLEDKPPSFVAMKGSGLYFEILASHRASVFRQVGIQDPADVDWGESWQPPPAVDDPDWVPLSELWIPWADLSRLIEPDLFACSRLVVDYILEQQGQAALPLMLEALGTSESMEEWVATVTGHSLEEFEPAWRAWVLEPDLR